ncbi:MAG: hypothetical protein ACLFQR_04505 [Desulfovibrionales bacterium]
MSEGNNGKNALRKWGGSAIFVGLTLGAAALLVRTAGGIASLLKRTKGVHLKVDVKAGEEIEKAPSTAPDRSTG